MPILFDQLKYLPKHYMTISVRTLNSLGILREKTISVKCGFFPVNKIRF